MRYAGTAMLHLSTEELTLIHRSLAHDNTPEAQELRSRIRCYLNAKNLTRHIKDGGTYDTWTPPLNSWDS